MNQIGLQPSSRLIEAEWLTPRLRPFGTQVTSVIPDGFPAYGRILHPGRGINDEHIPWADVAVNSGRRMHRLVQFHAINRPPFRRSQVTVQPPENGNLPPGLLRILCGALAEHTSTPDSCWFCLWEGYGWLHAGNGQRLSAALRGALRSELRVRLPQRNYLLLEGPLESATELGWSFPNEVFVPQSPNLFWPRDHAWCVASEIDLFCTLVAGSNALMEDLARDQRLEVWPVFAGDPITADSDDKNIGRW